MVIGIPKEVKAQEYRVSVTPEGVAALVADGHRVLCEASCGEGSGFSDDEYAAAGAEVAGQAGEVFAEADLVVKVKEPLPVEFDLLREGQALFTFLHLAPDRRLTDALLARKVFALAYETLQSGGELPLLVPMSEVAGRACVLAGAYFLQKPLGGTGVLPTGATGVPPARALVLGAGVVGANAVRVALGVGMDVTVISLGDKKLRALKDLYGDKITTALSTAENIKAALGGADLVVGAALVPGRKAPVLVTREMLALLKPGAVLADVAIDQGGCFETSRPTTHEAPVFVLQGVLHYCVPNIPGAYPRTSTLALTRVTLPYIRRLAAEGPLEAVMRSAELRSAANLYAGRVVHRELADSTGYEYSDI